MLDSRFSRFRPHLIFTAGLVIFAAAFWLHAKAGDLSSHGVHIQGTPGTQINATYTDTYQRDAYVDAARILLGLSAFLCGASAAAWLFVPAFRPATPTPKRSGDDAMPVLGRSMPTL